MIARRPSRRVQVGDVAVGGGAPVSIESMTKTDTTDVEATVRQIAAPATAGCEIVRVAVPTDLEAVEGALPDICGGRRCRSSLTSISTIGSPRSSAGSTESGSTPATSARER